MSLVQFENITREIRVILKRIPSVSKVESIPIKGVFLDEEVLGVCNCSIWIFKQSVSKYEHCVLFKGDFLDLGLSGVDCARVCSVEVEAGVVIIHIDTLSIDGCKPILTAEQI